MIETWKDIKDFEGFYQISNLGNVKSLKRTIKDKNGEFMNIEECMLRPCWLGNKYVINLCKGGKKKRRSIKNLMKIYFK